MLRNFIDQVVTLSLDLGKNANIWIFLKWRSLLAFILGQIIADNNQDFFLALNSGIISGKTWVTI